MFKLGGKTQVKAVVTKGTKCFSGVGGILVGAAAAVFLAHRFYKLSYRKKLSNETVLVMILRRGFGKGGEEG